MVFAGSAGAATAPVSQGTGRFLSGTVGGQSLDQVAAIKGATAVNYGGQSVRVANPLTASALGGAVNVPLTGALQIPGGGIANFGAVNQIAQANPDGSAYAASGAVANSGGISAGGQNGAQQANATLNLASLGGGALGNVVLSTGALSAVATEAPGTSTSTCSKASGRYQIGSLTLDLTSPALAQAFGPVITQVDALLHTGGFNGPSITQLTTFGNGGAISGNLSTGALRIDIGALVGNLNNLPPNTHLGPYLVDALGTQVPALVNAQIKAFITKLTASIGAAGPVLKPVLTQLFNQLSSPMTTAAAQLSTALAPAAQQLEAGLDLIANGQNCAAGRFTETSLVVLLGQGSGAQLNLAAAAVGPSQPLGAGAAAPQAPANAIKVEAGKGAVTGTDPMLLWGAVITGIGAAGAAGLVLSGRRARS